MNTPASALTIDETFESMSANFKYDNLFDKTCKKSLLSYVYIAKIH